MPMRGDLPPPPAASGRRASPGAPAPSRGMAGSSFWGGGPSGQPPPEEDEPFLGDSSAGTGSTSAKQPATETIGRRAGSLSDELDFPEFVASLIHGTWDAMVDSSIRQMDAFADLVAAISKPVEQFRDENITINQARDWLVGQHPADLELAGQGGGLALVPRGGVDEFGAGPEADWLADYGLEGQPLSQELIEEQLIPIARDRMARDRMQTLATLVMLGMQRIKVDDGSITARLRFRAAAADRAAVDYAVSDDPGGASPSGSWSTRGSTTYAAPVTKVSTVGVNAQTDSTLNAELFGEVKINFSSETLPLERFIDDAQRVLLERAARPAVASVARKASQSVAPATVAPPPVVEQPAPPAVPVAAPAPAPAPQQGAPA